MGTNSSKNKTILEILKLLSTNSKKNSRENLKIEYNINYDEFENEEENLKNGNNNFDSLDNDDLFELDDDDDEIILTLDNPNLNVKNTKMFPYCAIGIISVQFPISDEIFEYACFLINGNVVVTLAKNLENNYKGGKAIRIMTSFSKENVKWENIYIQREVKATNINLQNKDKNQNEHLHNLSSKLAVILYDHKISKEWVGVEFMKKEDTIEKDIYTTFPFRDNITKFNEGEEKVSHQKLRELFLCNVNPFFDISQNEYEKLELIKQSPGSPLYYRNYNNGVYVFGIINENFEYQYFDKQTMIFLLDMVDKGKLFRKKKDKDVDDENIVQIDLQGNNLGPANIKYIMEFDLSNLRILDLSNNSIKSEGAFYLSQGKFNSLESLHLSSNKIGDEGINHISKGIFNRLNQLYLSNNNISSEGVKYLLKGKFINELIILSLSQNPKIGDNGAKYINEYKRWDNLNMLNLDYTGLTDIGLNYLGKALMLKLKKLNIHGNKFTDVGKNFIAAIRENKINVIYQTEAEIQEKN